MACALRWRSEENVSGRRNTMMAIALVDGLRYAAVSIVVFVGILIIG
jgi:hypothetical protein